MLRRMRFSFARPVVFQAPVFGVTAGGPAQGSFEGTGIQRTYSAGLNYDRIFSSTLIMELRLGAAHYHNEAQNADYGTNSSQALGIPYGTVGSRLNRARKKIRNALGQEGHIDE